MAPLGAQGEAGGGGCRRAPRGLGAGRAGAEYEPGRDAADGGPGGTDFCAVCPRPRSEQTPSVCRLRRVPFNYPPGSLIEMILN
ncbi:unnamed protein product [Rangifer tarandus platyrhynchus]|uniref:Uncharacterized protein n=2 Tax=Rangifer tarandus platyrhynchus TaxID=3082113 RepID=A0ABN8XS35_RANTA|nr:unnamed protein product [Rangifer tarandus platyrhynchus]CAI9690619.1 unnamed protein product [Rangifer tarandus platyrhynchus]